MIRISTGSLAALLFAVCIMSCSKCHNSTTCRVPSPAPKSLSSGLTPSHMSRGAEGQSLRWWMYVPKNLKVMIGNILFLGDFHDPFLKNMSKSTRKSPSSRFSTPKNHWKHHLETQHLPHNPPATYPPRPETHQKWLFSKALIKGNLKTSPGFFLCFSCPAFLHCQLQRCGHTQRGSDANAAKSLSIRGNNPS